MKAWVLAGLLAVVTLFPVFSLLYFLKTKKADDQVASVQFEKGQHKGMVAGDELAVQSCKILDGYRFYMLLDNGLWVRCHLTRVAKENAVQDVVKILNQATIPVPTVVLLRHVDDYWVVDFRVTVNGQRSSVVDLIGARGNLL